MKGWHYLAGHAAPFRASLLFIGCLSIFASIATLALPWLAGTLLAGVIDADSVEPIDVALMLVAALAAMTVFNVLASILSARTSGKMLGRMRQEAYGHIQRLPLVFHDQHRRGDMLAVLSYELYNLSHFLTGTLAMVPSMLVTAGGALILLFLIDPSLAVYVPLLVPAFYIALRLVSRRLRIFASKAREAEALQLSIAEDQLDMLPAIKSFGVEQERAQIYDAQVEKSRQLTLVLDKIEALIGPLVALITGIAVVALIYFSNGTQQASERSAAELFSFLLYAALLTRPVGSLAGLYGRIQIARGTLGRIVGLIGEPVEAGYDTGDDPGDIKGAISFRGVSFAYPGRGAALRDVSLEIAAGEVVALTGVNGAGKSTLISLLMRLYVPDSGSIWADDRDIKNFQLQAWRKNIGYVPQRPLLFNGTVRENIAFGTPQAGEDQILIAAGLAQARDFIEHLPQGFETQIGDNGVRLSGGQRQRIALARALVSSPPILVLDEATSMYDPAGEAAFVEACKSALEGRTVIIITHRPASLALADRTLCIDQGQIAGGEPAAGEV